MTASSGRKVLRATGVVGGASVVVSGLGFTKNLIAAYYFGTTRGMDVYLLALVIPDLAQYLSITGLFNFIPLFAKARAEGGEAGGWQVAGKLVTLWFSVLLTVVLVCLVGAAALSWVVAPGLEPHAREIYILQTRLLCVMAAFMGGARILAAVHNARKHFVIPSLGEIAFQIGSIGYLVVFHELGTFALVGGMVFGGFCQLLVSAIGLGSAPIRVDLDPRHTAVKTMVRQSIPIYIANAAAKLFGVVMAAFASTLRAGQLSALQYALMPINLATTTVGLSMSRVLLPFLAEQHAEGRGRDLTRSLDRGMVTTTLVMLPASVGLFLLARPTVRLLFERGSFNARSTEITVTALQIFAPLLLVTCLNSVLSTVYFAQGDTVTPTRTGLLRVAVGILLCALLVGPLGYRGLALANVASAGLKAGLLMALMRGEEQRRAVRSALRSCLRLLAATGVMSAVVYPLSLLHPLQHFTLRPLPVSALLGTILCGIGAYAMAVRAFSRADFDYVTSSARDLLGVARKGAAAR